MVDPWTIIGWIVLAALAVVAALSVGVYVVIPAYLRYCHLRTRDTPAAAGQVWLLPAGNERIEVLEILESGALRLRSGWRSWSESPETWLRSVRAQKLILIQLAPEKGKP